MGTDDFKDCIHGNDPRLCVHCNPALDKIEEGDIVSINFNNAQTTLSTRAEVLYVPCASGDSWHFRDLNTKQIYYISEGCTITLIEKRNI